MKISPEDGQILDRDEHPGGGVVQTPPPLGALTLRELLDQALRGTLQTERPLKDDEVRRFQPHHVVMVLDFVQGMRSAEVAAKHELAHDTVLTLKRHPFTQSILRAMFMKVADNLADPVQRIKGYAHEAIDVQVELMRDVKTTRGLRSHIARDILDRAGFGARQRLSVELPEEKTKPSVPSTHLSRIADALEAAQSVRGTDYERFVTRAAPQEDAELVNVSSEDGFGNQDSDGGASLASPPQPHFDEPKKLEGEALEFHEQKRAEERLPEGIRLARSA